ncbi:MAG: hypothetical protein JSS68_18150 [Actinobacteria bacterium]|nr:hypothetical protein [Actinomycetota bacterium]
MNKRIGLVVLAALCAVAFSAVAASGAGAAINPYTAYTCVSDPLGTFENAHCNPNAPSDGGHYKHVAIPAGETTQLTVQQIGSNTVLKTKIGLATVTLEATGGVECVGCHFKNVEGGSVEAKGGHLRYTGVHISVPSCKVTGEEVNTEPLEVNVTEMEGTDPSGTYIASVSPVTPGTEAVIHLENNGATCTLGSSITVTGHATGKATGSTAKFATGEGELLVGTQKAELIGELTLKGGLTPTPENPNPVHNPIGLTTGA